MIDVLFVGGCYGECVAAPDLTGGCSPRPVAVPQAGSCKGQKWALESTGLRALCSAAFVRGTQLGVLTPG